MQKMMYEVWVGIRCMDGLEVNMYYMINRLSLYYDTVDLKCAVNDIIWNDKELRTVNFSQKIFYDTEKLITNNASMSW